MNIRTLLLLISVVGAISSASVVLFFMDEKISVQEEANNSLQISSYRETWDRLIGSDKLLLENFGLQGQSSYFWSPENPSPLNRGDGPGIYQLDLSGTSTGEVLNPLVEAVLARDARAAETPGRAPGALRGHVISALFHRADDGPRPVVDRLAANGYVVDATHGRHPPAPRVGPHPGPQGAALLAYVRVADGHIDVPNSDFVSLRRHLKVMPDLVSAVDGASVRLLPTLFVRRSGPSTRSPSPTHKAPQPFTRSNHKLTDPPGGGGRARRGAQLFWERIVVRSRPSRTVFVLAMFAPSSVRWLMNFSMSSSPREMCCCSRPRNLRAKTRRARKTTRKKRRRGGRAGWRA